MKKLFCLITLALSALLYSCDISTNEKVPSNLEGHWLSKDYLDALSNSLSPQEVSAQLPFYITEIVMHNNVPDSIMIFNGQMESGMIPFKRSGDTLRLKINQDTETEMIYNASAKTISFTDKSLNRSFTFTRADSSLIDKTFNPAAAFQSAINKMLLEGTWELTEDSSATRIVMFDRFGQVKGWGKYLSYTICVNGDCAGNETGDLIILNNKNTADEYGFRSKNDTIRLFKLQQINDPDEKPVYRNGEALMILVRKKSTL